MCWRVAVVVPLILVIVMLTQPAKAQTYTVLYTVEGGADGYSPGAGMITDGLGNFYGTTTYGGANCFTDEGCGVVFKIDSLGNFTTLHIFTGYDGDQPGGRLVRDENGNLYGTTVVGGLHYYGTVFKVDSAGNETVLYNFDVTHANPEGSLIRDSSGNLYGTVVSCAGSPGCVFKLDPLGNYTVLHSFSGGADGSDPTGNLLAVGGYIYGTTQGGGNPTKCKGYSGCGVVFKVDGLGNETVLYRFSGADGAIPMNGVVRDAVGNLYGTTSRGGTYGKGVIFKLDPSGNETVLHHFTNGDNYPQRSSLVRDERGNLYGASYTGGENGSGYVYALTPDGRLYVLHTFTGPDGAAPVDMLGVGGSLYGITYVGGNGGCYNGSGCGVVFKISR